MAAAIDGTSPAIATGSIANNGGTLATASFTAPTDAFLVAFIAMECYGSEPSDMTITDSGGLTWTQRPVRTWAEAIEFNYMASYTARTTSSTARTVTLTRVGSGGGDGALRLWLKVFVVTGVDVNGTPIDTTGASNEGSTSTNNATTTSLTPGATGLHLVAAMDVNGLGTYTSSDLTIQTSDQATTSFGTYNTVFGYKTATSGVGSTANLNAGGTGTAGQDWLQVIIREAGGGGGAVQPKLPLLGVGGALAVMAPAWWRYRRFQILNNERMKRG